MPGSYIFKPLEANLTHKTNLFSRMDPYCSFRVGRRRIQGSICENGGKHPHWHDSITIPVTREEKVLVELRNKDKVLHHNSIGSCIVDLCEIENQGSTTKWYVLYYKNKKAGEILLEAIFQPDGLADNSVTNICDKTIYGLDNSKNESLGILYQQEKLTSEINKEQEYIFTQQEQRNSNFFIEQRQVVEPHTFFGEVEVVETRPMLKEVEVMKPIKVMKDVEFTQVVPVKKQLQVSKPYVVVKEVEVMEPQLVNKTIQVVENVTVKKMIEVIEMRKVMKEIETVEPQTFTKQVEVTELMPARKEVEVTQPITLKKAVEFVEPVITTKTITKEVHEPVVVSEKMTTSVGPASVAGMSERYREDFYVKEAVGNTKIVKDEKIQWRR